MKYPRAALTVLLSGGLLAALGLQAWAAISISLTGGWSKTIDATSLAGGAGSDRISTHESAADAVSLTISGTTGPSDSWRIDVTRVDTTWHSTLALSVRRTSEGTGGSVSGGGSYQTISDVNTTFFSGAGDVADIAVQLRLSGISLQVPAKIYTTTVYYTVVDN
jgi:hypothetical protein